MKFTKKANNTGSEYTCLHVVLAKINMTQKGNEIGGTLLYVIVMWLHQIIIRPK